MKCLSYLFSMLWIVMLSCNANNESIYPKLDLLQYGMPITILAPSDAEVTSEDLGIWKDVTIKSGTDYYLQIIASQATTFDKSKILSDQIRSVKEGAFFSKIIEENEDGIIFEKKIDEENLNYDFRYVKLLGDKEYIFQTGLIGSFTEEEVRKMYNSVK